MNGDYGIEFLDMFYDDCVKHRQFRDVNVKLYQKAKVKRSIMMIVMVVMLYVAFVLVGLFAKKMSNPAPVIMGITMGGPLAVLIFSRLFGYKTIRDFNKEQIADNINYEYLDEYLAITGKSNIRMARPHCITGPAKKPMINKYATIAATIAFFAVFVIGAPISYINLNGFGEDFGWSLFVLIFAAVGVTLFVHTVVKNAYLAMKCKEAVYAVCVEVNRTMSHSSGHSRMVEMPVFYTRCANGHAYVLYEGAYTNVNNKKVGMLVPIMVNPDNPIEWTFTKMSAATTIVSLISFAFMGLGFFAYIMMLIG